MPADPQLSEKFVHESLQKWTRELNAQTRKVTRLRKLLTLAQARRQKAQWFVKRRRKQLAKIRSNPVRRVLDAALKHVGETEQPAGSNRGPGIVSACQKTILGYDGVAWCGCYVGHFLKTIARVPVNARIAYTPFIHEDAAAGRNGMSRLVEKTSGQPGDLALFHFGSGGIKHVAFILERIPGGYKTLEGNTSFDNAGSQNNGGCVAVRTRPDHLIHSIARPDYA